MSVYIQIYVDSDLSVDQAWVVFNKVDDFRVVLYQLTSLYQVLIFKPVSKLLLKHFFLASSKHMHLVQSWIDYMFQTRRCLKDKYTILKNESRRTWWERNGLSLQPKCNILKLEDVSLSLNDMWNWTSL